jgi:Tol biopolymer transport system component
MRHNHRSGRRLPGAGLCLVVAAALVVTACSERAESPLAVQEDGSFPPAGVVVSESRAASALDVAGGVGPGTDVDFVYVSSQPDTWPGAASVRIRNLTSGAGPTPVIPVRDGGFDPVAVPAHPGDRLELAILGGDGQTHVVNLSVPSRRPPTVVRTNPRRGRTDVALSVQPVVVFSEPIDPQSLTPSSVGLLRDGTPVAGVVALVPGSPFMAQFVPEGLLEPDVDYELVVTTAIRDLDGDALEEAYRVDFRTTSNPTVGPANIAIVSGDQQQGRAGRELAEPFVVRVTDAQGAPIPGAAVTWSVDWPYGILDGHRGLCPEDGAITTSSTSPVESGHIIYVTVTTNADGLATMSFVPTSISRKWVRAELAEFDTVHVNFWVDASDPGASMEIVSGNDQEASAGPLFADEPLVVRVKDGRGAPVENVSVIWGVPSGDVVLGNACSQTVIDWSEEEQAFTALWTFWAARTGPDGTAAVEYRPRALGTSEVNARILGHGNGDWMTDGVTFTLETTSLIIGLSRDPSDGGAPTFLGPHLTSDAGVPVGGVVEFWNRESTARIVSTSSPAGGASFDSGPLQRDERFRFVPDVAGTWEFVDEVSGAKGTLTARSADAGHGAILVSNVTTGGAFDPDGYRVTIRTPGHPHRTDALALNNGIRVPQVAAGPATVEVHDLAGNCSVTGTPIRSVTVPRNAQVPVEFAVTCTPPPELAAVRLVLVRGGHLWMMNADGTGLRQLTSGAVTDVQPIVSPDGSRIAFSRSRDAGEGSGHFRVHLIDANTSKLTQLSDYWVPDIAWSWSPAGGNIATQTGWSNGRIDVIGMDGTRRSLLNGIGGSGHGNSPAWSPDDRTIAFYRYNDETNGWDVWAMDADGRNQRIVRRLGTPAPGGLRWARGGSEILFTYLQPGNRYRHSLWRVNPDGTDAARLIELPLNMRSGAGSLSPGGKFLTMTANQPYGTDIYLVDLEDGSLVRVTADGLSSSADFLR